MMGPVERGQCCSCSRLPGVAACDDSLMMKWVESTTNGTRRGLRERSQVCVRMGFGGKGTVM